MANEMTVNEWNDPRNGRDDTPEYAIAIREKRIAELEGANVSLRAALEKVLASAYPHPTEHPTMTEAWKIAHAALTTPATAEALERVRKEAKVEMFDEIRELYYNMDRQPFNDWLDLKNAELRGGQ